MKWALFLIFTAMICSLLWMWQMDNHTTATAYLRLKQSLDRATHDAALQIKHSLLADEARLEFSDDAETVLWSSLEQNLRMQLNDGAPAHVTSTSLFRIEDPLQLLLFERLEKGCSSALDGFPCTYVNGTYGYVDTIRGPSIVAIIAMRHPRPFALSQERFFIVGSSHEYVAWSTRER